MMACGGDGACRWVTIEVWLDEAEAIGGDVRCAATDRQVCLACGAARLVREPDERWAPPPQPLPLNP